MIRNNLRQKGQILVVVFITLGVVLFTVLSVVAGAQIYFQNTIYTIDSEKAMALAEAGVDKAFNSLNETGGSYIGESETKLEDGSYSVTITTKDISTKIIESTGYIPNKEISKVKKTVKIETSLGTGVAFNYGVQVGEGGLELRGGNLIKGSVYSNGNIIVVSGGGEDKIEGDAWIAEGPATTSDQQTDCDGSNCTDYLFGKNISGENRLDLAQSFKPSITQEINKVSIKIKKIGSPPDVTFRILGDNDNKPDKNNVKATGILHSSLVTSSYGWIDVTFDSTPTLSVDTTYWLMIDSSSNSANYWSWQSDLAQSYNRGVAEWSANWSTSHPAWTLFNNDLSFKLFLGGNPTRFEGADNIKVLGNVHANTIKDVSVLGDAYYQTIISSSVEGISYPNSEDPPPKVFPISDANIADWKASAEMGGIIPGFSSCQSQILSRKIEGDVDLDGCNLVVKSPIWITGNLILKNSNVFTLSSEYGSASGVIIVDGKVEMKNTNHFKGTGIGNSLLMVLSGYDSRTTGEIAIEVKNTGNSGVFYAGNGIISPGNGNSFKELTAWKITLVQNSVIDYEQGLSSTLFSAGPTGGYSLIKGTYQVK